jgi:hypothetical protein
MTLGEWAATKQANPVAQAVAQRDPQEPCTENLIDRALVQFENADLNDRYSIEHDEMEE